MRSDYNPFYETHEENLASKIAKPSNNTFAQSNYSPATFVAKTAPQPAAVPAAADALEFKFGRVFNK